VGSGKTTLATTLLRGVRRWAILDPKHTIRIEGVKIRGTFAKRDARQIIRAPFPAEDYETPLLAAYHDRNRVVYVDETTLVNTAGSRLSPALGRVIRTGRELGVGCWLGSQRPKDIPSAVFTEAEHFFVFQLTWEEDRKKVGAFTTDKVLDLIGTLRGHEFVYYNVLTNTVKKLQLELGKGR
jgi:DNA helicase HerA-like ATPase